MKAHTLTCFLSLAEQGSYAGAAQVLGISPPEVSVAVRALEEDMGVSLVSVSRADRAVRLTRAGEVVRARLMRYLQSLARLREQAQAAGGLLLRVAVSEGVSPPEVSARLQAPGAGAEADESAPLDFTIRRVTLAKQRAGLAWGEFDAGLSQARAAQEDQELTVAMAWREPLVALLPAAHPLASRPTLELSMLDAPRLFVMAGGYVEQIAELLRAHQPIDLELELRATPGEMLLAVQEGNGAIGLMGATQWPTSNKTRGPRVKNLVSRPVADARTGEPLWLTTYLRHPRQTTPALAEALARLARGLARIGR